VDPTPVVWLTYIGKKTRRKFLKSSFRTPSSFSGASTLEPSRGALGGWGTLNMPSKTGDVEKTLRGTRKSASSTCGRRSS
jgi:hypothetical protein